MCVVVGACDRFFLLAEQQCDMCDSKALRRLSGRKLVEHSNELRLSGATHRAVDRAAAEFGGLSGGSLEDLVLLL